MFNPFFTSTDSEPILRDVFPDWATGSGIFDQIAANATIPWAEDENVTSDILDIEYFGNHSGGRFCSPLVKYLLDDNGVVPTTGRVTLAKAIIAKHLTQWQHLWDTTQLEYSPITNYDMTENRTLTRAEDEQVVEDRDQTHGGSTTLAHGLTDTISHGKTNSQTTYQYGFNSTTPEQNPTDQVESEEGGTTVDARSGTDTSTQNLTDTDDSTVTTDNDITEEEEIHRIGNIGVTTNQKLIQEERNLWIWTFFERVFSDVDKELTLAVFDPCRV